MARITIGRGGRGGSVVRHLYESNAESSQGRRRSNVIEQVPHDPSKRKMITLDGGRFTAPTIHMIIYIFKNMFNGSWTTWNEVNRSARDELWVLFKIREGLHYNPYFPGGAIAMPKMLMDGAVEYEDGTPATEAQMGKDIVSFLSWAAEPEMEERKLLKPQGEATDDATKSVFNLGVVVGDLTVEEDESSNDISLEGLQQELEECKADEILAEKISSNL